MQQHRMEALAPRDSLLFIAALEAGGGLLQVRTYVGRQSVPVALVTRWLDVYGDTVNWSLKRCEGF